MVEYRELMGKGVYDMYLFFFIFYFFYYGFIFFFFQAEDGIRDKGM